MAGSNTALVVVASAGALVIGLVLGGLRTQGEISSLREEVTELKRRSARAGAGRGFTTLLTAGLAKPDAVMPPPAQPSEPLAIRVEDGRVVEGAPGTPVAGDAPLVIEDPADNDTDQDDVGDAMQDGMDDMRTAIEARYAQARASLIQDAQPSASQLQAIDDATGRMNDTLFTLTEAFVADTLENGEPSRRDMMAISAEALGVMVDAEDAMLNALDDDQRAALQEESTDPTAWIDPSIVDALAPLQDMAPR